MFTAPRSRFSLVALFSVMVALGACGRSSTLGSSPYDCDPGSTDPACHPDLSPPRDGGRPPGDGSMCPGNNACTGPGACGKAGCCDCTVCQGALECQIPDGGPVDMTGDPCSDKKNCKLPECVGDPRCIVLGTEICNNGIDDNNDGLVDCADPECVNFPGCQVTMCDPKMPDCTSPACVNDPRCQDLKCMPTVDFGTLQPRNSTSTRSFSTTGTKDVAVTPCAPGGGGMVVTKFTLVATSEVTLTFTQQKGEDHVFGLFRAGINQGCGQNPVDCYDPKSATTGSHTFVQLGAGEYYLIAQPFSPQGQGPLTVTLSTPSMPEICNNGVDDNNNGLIDCADPDCLTDPNCINSQCNPDFNLGALVVNAGGKSVSFNTRSATDSSLNLTCQQTKGGKDVAIKFTLKETAGILVDWSQRGGDHAIGLFRMPPLGDRCDTDQLSCFDPSGAPNGEVAFGEYPPGDYLVIVKSMAPGDEGPVDIMISAYRNRRIELCHNGIDDDGNGLIDCADPACVGVAGCSAPYCMPDVQLGNMSVGDSQTVNLNIAQDGHPGLQASCARGGGKGMVVQFTVPTKGPSGGLGVGFECTETGDQVLTLNSAGGTRDACDVNELVCGDPKTLPFGCNYEVPNLQPGTYNVIVEAFRPGSEGTMQLTLSILDDRSLEICNNGIDDDGNGLIDCADPKCATWPSCQQSICSPDATIDPVPLTGINTFRLVQTAMNGVHGQAPCATAPGGQSAVIEIQLTAKADLTMVYNQIGNHDVALFTRAGNQLPCDAGTLLQCDKSNGLPTVTTQYKGVPQGRYYLIIQGDQPDGTTQYSGSVNIALSGTPSP